MNKLFRERKKDLFMDTEDGGAISPYMHIFTNRLRELIAEEKAKGLSEADVARSVNVSERSFNHYTKRGSQPRDPAVLIRICERLNTHPNYLFGFSPERFPRDPGAVNRLRSLEREVERLSRTIEDINKKTP